MNKEEIARIVKEVFKEVMFIREVVPNMGEVELVLEAIRLNELQKDLCSWCTREYSEECVGCRCYLKKYIKELI